MFWRRRRPSFSFECRSCGEVHEGLPAFGPDAPLPFALLDDAARARAVLTADQCIIDDRQFYLRGQLEVPIHGLDEPFVWLVWVSVSQASHERMGERWETPGREADPPHFGWLCTALPYEPATLSLKTHVHTRPIGQRPWIELEATDHPLSVEQREGISLERARQLVQTLLHPTG